MLGIEFLVLFLRLSGTDLLQKAPGPVCGAPSTPCPCACVYICVKSLSCLLVSLNLTQIGENVFSDTVSTNQKKRQDKVLSGL